MNVEKITDFECQLSTFIAESGLSALDAFVAAVAAEERE